MFDIFFEPGDPVAYDDDGWLGLRGLTVLEDFEESFVAPLGWWSRLAYERQWIEGARRLTAGHTSAFVLEPARLWWTAWIDVSEVVIRQQLTLAPEHADAWRRSPDLIPYELVGDRHPPEDPELPPSEWRVSLVAIGDFLSRAESRASSTSRRPPNER